MTSDGPLSAYWWMNGNMRVVEKDHVLGNENGVGSAPQTGLVGAYHKFELGRFLAGWILTIC